MWNWFATVYGSEYSYISKYTPMHIISSLLHKYLDTLSHIICRNQNNSLLLMSKQVIIIANKLYLHPSKFCLDPNKLYLQQAPNTWFTCAQTLKKSRFFSVYWISLVKVYQVNRRLCWKIKKNLPNFFVSSFLGRLVWDYLGI